MNYCRAPEAGRGVLFNNIRLPYVRFREPRRLVSSGLSLMANIGTASERRLIAYSKFQHGAALSGR